MGGLWIALDLNPARSLIAWRLTFAFGIIWIPVTYAHFIKDLCRFSWNMRIHYAACTLIALLALFHPLFISGVRFVFGAFYYCIPGSWLFHLFLIWWSLLFVYTHYCTFVYHRNHYSLQSFQAISVLSGTVAGTLLGMLGFLPAYGIDLYPYGNFGISASLSFILLTMGKYRLFGIRTTIHKTALWLVTSALSLVPFIVILDLGRLWWPQQPPLKRIWVEIALLALFMGFYWNIQKRVDRLFQRQWYNLQAVLEEARLRFSTLKSLSQIANEGATIVGNALGVSPVIWLFWSARRNRFRRTHYQSDEMTDVSTHHSGFLHWLALQKTVITRYAVMRQSQYMGIRSSAEGYFTMVQAAVAVPILEQETLIAVLNVGEKQRSKHYTNAELDFLSAFALQMQVTISNASLHEEQARLLNERRRSIIEIENKVTERTKQLSESKDALAAAYHQLKLLGQQRNRLFANINHELRTPLTLIMTPIEIMLGDRSAPVSPQHRTYLTLMRNAAVMMRQLLGNLLDLDRIESGQMRLSYRHSNMVEVVRQVVESVSPIMVQKSLDLRVFDRVEVPDTVFDPDRITQVVLNLLFNAIKFTPDGHIEMACLFEEGYVGVRVSDTGIGLPKESQGKLFTRFYTTDSPNPHYVGSGIGLAVSKEIIDLHRGRIWATNNPTGGSTFAFLIPIYTSIEAAKGDDG